jgi:hypothetical protein
MWRDRDFQEEHRKAAAVQTEREVEVAVQGSQDSLQAGVQAIIREVMAAQGPQALLLEQHNSTRVVAVGLHITQPRD